MKTRNQFQFIVKRVFGKTVLLLSILALYVKTDAQCGSALKFDTTDMSYIWGESITDIYENFTMEFWVKPDRTIREGINEMDKQYDAVFNQSYAIFPDYYTPESNECAAGVSVGTNGVLVCETAGEYMPASLVYYNTISSTNWTHIAVVFKDGTPSLYINGDFKKTGTRGKKKYVHPSPHIGDNTGTEKYGPFGGSVDEFRIWGSTLSSATIANWYDRVVTSSHPNFSDLYLYLTFDEGSGSKTSDKSGNENPIYFELGPSWVKGWQYDFSDAIPDCEISASTTDIYLGYGSQTTTLTGSGGESYNWKGSNLSSTSDKTTVLSPPSGDGYYNINLTTTSQYGCINTCEKSICVLDIIAPGGSNENPKVYICHEGNGRSEMPKTIGISVNTLDAHIGRHSGDKLGKCGQACSSVLEKKSNISSGEIYANTVANLLVYPNPSKGVFHFEIESQSLNPIKIKIYDYTGKLLFENIEGAPNSDITFNLKNFTKGVYYAKITHGNFNKTVKLIFD